MEPNKLLGMVLMLTGVADIIIARMMGSRLPERTRSLISVIGAGFILLGSLLSLGLFKVV